MPDYNPPEKRDAKPAKKKKHKKEESFSSKLFDFVTPDYAEPAIKETARWNKNLIVGAGKAAHGTPRAIKDVSSALFDPEFLTADVSKRSGRQQARSSKAGKIAKQTSDAYKYTYGPLANGDFQEFYKRVSADPLGPVLDAMALATLGGSVVSRTGLSVAKRAPEGSRASRAGLKVSSSELVPVRAGSTAGIDLAHVRAGSRERRIGGEHAGGEHIVKPKPRTLRVGDKDFELGHVQTNPLRRVEQSAFDSISEAFGGNLKFIGAQSRVTRLETGRSRRAKRRGSYAAVQAKSIIDDLEKDASPEAAKAFQILRNRAEGVDADKAVEQLERDRDAVDFMDPEQVRDLRGRRGKIQARQAARKKSGMGKSEELDYQARDVEGLLKSRKHKDAILPQMDAKIELQTKVRDEGLHPDYEAPVNMLLSLLRDNSHEITKAYEATGLNPDPARAVRTTQRVTGTNDNVVHKKVPLPDASPVPETDTFPLPQTIDKTMDRAIQQKSSASHRPGNSARPDSSMFRSGFNVRFGLETLSPRNAVWANQVAQEYKRGAKTVDTILSAGRRHPLGAPVPKGWKRIQRNAATERYAENLRAFADDEAPIMFGESPQLHDVQQRIFGLIDNLTDDASDWIVPEKFQKRMLQEIKPTGRVPGLDTMNGIWRVATVSAVRPAFLENNIVGQSIILLMAHSPYKMLKHRMDYSADKEARAVADKYMAGVMGSGQAAMIGKMGAEDIGHGGKAREKLASANEAIGNLGQKITDDPYRRIAFAAEAFPQARKIQAERRKTDPTYTFPQALEELLSDETTLDRIERKVLDDLVDFEDLTHAERIIVRRAISPFYSWIKGSSRLTAMWIANNPTKAAVLSRLGQQGFEDNLQDWGGGKPVPNFMGGLIPYGKTGAITTAQFNPVVTPVDAVSQIGALVGQNPGGEEYGPSNLLAGAPPFTKAAFSAWSGFDPFTGEATPGDNPAERAASTFATSFPQVKWAQRIGELRKRQAQQEAAGTQGKSLGFILTPSQSVEGHKYFGGVLGGALFGGPFLPYREVDREAAIKRGDKVSHYERLEIPGAADGTREYTNVGDRIYGTFQFDPDAERSSGRRRRTTRSNRR